MVGAVDVFASAPGVLNAWIDFNANGSWADGGDQIFFDQPLAAGLNSLTFPIPADAMPGAGTFARFRYSTQPGGLSFDGPAPDGEVEDYQVLVTRTPGAPDLVAAYDTGQSDSDDTTKLDNSAPSRVLQFSVPGTVPGAMVRLYADGTFIGANTAAGPTTIVTTNGVFDLVDGAHSITARQAQTGEFESPDSAALKVRVDTNLPFPSQPDLNPASDTGHSDSDDYTQGITPQFDGTAFDPPSNGFASGIWKVVVTADDGSAGVDASSPFYSVTLPTLPEGSRVIVAEAFDVAGNRAGSPNLRIEVDRTGPQVAAFGLSSTSVEWVLGVVDSAEWTAGRPARTVAGATVDELVVDFDEAVVAVLADLTLVGLDQGAMAISSLAGPGTGQLVWTLPAYLGNDRYLVTVFDSVVDLAGNDLDGEPHGDLFPSGDAIVGGDWLFELNVLIGDTSGDGVVDDDDLSLLLAGWNKPGGWNKGNLNGDNTVDDDDLSLLLANWGQTLPTSAGAALGAALAPISAEASSLLTAAIQPDDSRPVVLPLPAPTIVTAQDAVTDELGGLDSASLRSVGSAGGSRATSATVDDDPVDLLTASQVLLLSA